MPHSRPEITAEFPGAPYPVGCRVWFVTRDGSTRTGVVVTLRMRHAEVVADEGHRYTVPYGKITLVRTTVRPDCTLTQVEELAAQLITKHQDRGTLPRGWRFGFDLAPARAGVCNFSAQRINLSVSYCLRATRAEIQDTILHEIAHAMVGPRHNHDAVWKSRAQMIGCSGERCHRVEHSAPRWIGECGCGQQWFRHRLQRKLLSDRVCAKCRGVITWLENSAVGD